jgi:hypothetical protein
MSTQGTAVRPVWPSAFQWLEQPFYSLNEERNKNYQDKEHAIKSGSRFFSPLMGQYIYWPLVMCATPLSLLADAVAGIVEASLYAYQGDSLRAKSILHKKLIASPIQHLVFFSGNLLLPAIIGSIYNRCLKLDISSKTIFGLATLAFGPMGGLMSYHLSQFAVGKLPNFARPEGFNIFINGGCLDPNGKKMTDPDHKYVMFPEKQYV